MKIRTILLGGVLLAALFHTNAHAGNLVVNGDFSANNGENQTPPDWSQLGPADGVIANSTFGTPSYNGANYYYDLGGYGDAQGTQGDGFYQYITTVVGTSYQLTFGLSGENEMYTTELGVTTGSAQQDFFVTVNSAYGLFQKPWTTETIDFMATSTSTLIQFEEISPTSDNGYNDPLVTGIVVDATGSPVPEPAAMSILGLGLVGLALARRRAV